MTKRKIVTLLLAAILLLSVVVAAPKAAATAAYTVALTGTDGKDLITAKPGDTVTLLLSVENNPGIVSLGVNISCPSGLSVVSHEVPADAAAKMKSTGKFTPNIKVTESNPFVFYMNQATGTTEKKPVTYNGTLYQITFKVSNDAVNGDYKISLAARSGTNYTSDVDGSGKIVDASVNAVGSINMAGCTIRVENTCTSHQFGSWTDAGNGKHKRTCKNCAAPEIADHTWNGGEVTKKPTCAKVGVKTYTCTACKATKKEDVAKLKGHTYDNTCDTSCNVCSATRTVTHKYQTQWRTDKAQHWHQCSVCGAKKDIASHTPGPEATQTKAQVCTVCDYVITPALNHKCVFGKAWTTDETGHYHACDGCEEQDSYAKHVFDNACDPDCSVCGYVRQVNHTYDTKWTSDEENHWYACTVCGEKKDMKVHEFYTEVTDNGVKTCSVCDYKTAPVPEETTEETTVPEEIQTETTVPEETHTATTPSDYEGNTEDIQVQILGIIAITVLGVAVAALIFHLVIKKKSATL